MKLELLIDGRPRSLQVLRCEGDCEFVFESTPAKADVREVEPDVYSILIDGRSYEVKIEPAPECCYATLNGRRYVIEVRDPRRLSRTRGPLRADGRQKIASPMPGKVVRVLVQEGDEVAAGQGVVVVEAMKMQNEIRSPKAGRVVAVRVAQGAPVGGGETLAEVE